MLRTFGLLILLSAAALADASYYSALHDNPLIEESLKEKVLRHLIPPDHPIKATLDIIFSQSRVTENLQSIERAGFIVIHSMPKSFAVIAKHPSVPGYIFKMHLDSEKTGRHGTDSTDWLINRCVAAKKIKKIIEKKRIRHFVVPDKWLYLLPLHLHSCKSSPKPLIVIATELPIAAEEETKAAWKTVAGKEHLKELYSILNAGYGSITLPTNIPYLGNGIFAFVDTEKPVIPKRLKRVANYLSPPMQKYWMHLID